MTKNGTEWQTNQPEEEFHSRVPPYSSERTISDRAAAWESVIICKRAEENTSRIDSLVSRRRRLAGSSRSAWPLQPVWKTLKRWATGGLSGGWLVQGTVE